MNSKLDKWFVFLASLIMIALINVDMTIVNLSLSSISKDFNASVQESQWIISSYLLSTGLSFVLLGKIADIVGHTKVYIFGIFCFALASLFIGFSSNMTTLLLWRFIQGIGFAGTLGLSFIIILDYFSFDKRGTITGICVTVSGFSQAIGPTLGGFILSILSWRWIFWLNVPLCIISLIFILIYGKNQNTINCQRQINLKNVMLFILGLGNLLLTMSMLSDLSRSEIFTRLLLSIIFLYKFFQTSRKFSYPLVDLHLFKNWNFSALIVVRFIFMLLQSSSLFIIPLYLQNILGYSPLKSGLILLFMTLCVMVVSPLTGKLVDAIGYRIPVTLSMILSLLASIIIFSWQVPSTPIGLYAGLIILGFAIGIHTSSTICGINQVTPKETSGIGIGIFFTLAISGAISGVGISTNMLLFYSQQYLSSHIEKINISADLIATSSGTRSIFILPHSLHELATSAFMSGLYKISLLHIVLMSVGFLISLTINQERKPEFKAEYV